MQRRQFIKMLGWSVFLPFFGKSRRKRRWYVAQDMGTGTIVDPYTLSEALASDNIKPGDTVYLRGGIYQQPESVTWRFSGGNENNPVMWRAYEGERPVITNANGGVPRINPMSHAHLDGLWVGGEKGINDYAVPMGNNAVVQNCTFFGFNQCIIEGDGYANSYVGNRFVRCGNGWLQHPLYIASGNRAIKDDLVEGNILVASQGWSIHIWHAPESITVRNNFVGAASVAFASSGQNHSFVDNIFWSSRNDTWCNFGSWANSIFKNNIIGTDNPGTPHGYQNSNAVNDGNYWLREPMPFDASPTVWQDPDVQANLGDSSANIDAAIAALDTAFQQTVAQIQADATIETHFATLKAVIDTWKANTV